MEKLKKNICCTNCNRLNHDYKECKEPITSWGIILVNLSHIDKKDLEHSAINLKSRFFTIYPRNYKELEDLSNYMNSIRFLLVQRKHSIGFMDFVRGKYKLDNIDQINSLFSHMNKNEIELIRKKTFDELWHEIWNNDQQRINNLKREYSHAKTQFDKLRDHEDTELNLDFYVNNVTPLYSFNEWGFPKGRRDKNESTIECALREFSEETEIGIDKIKIIENIEPIEENLVGTNGVPYRHIYYVAEVQDDILPSILNNNETGGIGYFNFNETGELIRDYHIEKKNVLRILHMYYLELLLKS